MKSVLFLYSSFQLADPGKNDGGSGGSGIKGFLTELIETVTGIGALVFTLAVLIIALCIIFGSISPKNIGKWWTALFSCVAGAVIFFGAGLINDTISKLF